ncbi:MAG: hypothetical protein JWO19_2356 [Bryobacterales bacterium]|jgi:hypothetical protein|nr:hypothetical protein [Bryobacterales bacterium]
MRLLPLIALLLATPGASWAGTITFAEFGTAPLIDVNGFHTQGVTFGFAPGQGFYNQSVGTAGNALLSVDPVLSGSTDGVLTLAFDYSTSVLVFDVLLQSVSPIDDSNRGLNGGPAYTVLLSNGLSFNGSTTPLVSGGYSEGEFSYSGAAINGATITFFNGLDANGLPVSQFGFDNLTFVAPEPASFFGLAGGLLAIGMIKRRQPGSNRRV